MFRGAGGEPAAGYEEEWACDVWARKMLTSNMEEYADNQGYTYAQVAQKRAMGIALAAIIVHAMTPTHAQWGNDDYPPIAARIRAMIDGHNLSDGSPFWTFTACLLIAIMRHKSRQIELVPTSAKAVVGGLLHLTG